MPQASKTFRIFVSSTFSDMKVERNALQEHVFPRLRELCMQHGTRFQAIDLRWGVSEEASLDQQTMKICLEEIARCQRVTPRPNFIVLLGDRYGWQPLPEEIPAAEFEAILERVSPEERALLCWEEQDAAGRRGWYRRDDNAVPAVYVLQPREGEFEDYSTWHTKVERPLLQVLRQAVASLDLPPEARLRYEASAAHQEIEHGAMQVEDADEHVFGFFRRITNLAEVKNDLPGPAAKDYVDSGADDLFDADAYRRLQDLKGQLGERIGHNIHNYAAQWTGEGITTDHIGRLPEEMAACQAMLAEEYVPQNLCEAVWRALALVILAECEQLEEKGALELEVEAHAEFGQERARFFVGREAILEAIATYLAGGSQHPLAVWGPSGTGKSAMMARAVRKAQEAHPEAEVVYRFIGATPDSSNGRALLESLCRQVSEAYGADASDLPLKYRDLVSEFPKRLALATSDKPLVLFLDALDQLSDADNARSLIWLPRQLPAHVKLVVSTLPGECLDALRARLPQAQRLELEPLPSEEGADLLDRWLASVGRTLQPEQKAEVLHEFNRCGLPLYLKLAFEEARRWRSYDGVPDLGSDIPGIIQNLFQRLSDEPNHGEMLVSRSLGYLAAAKNGLTEDELLDVLSADGEVMEDFYRRSPQSPEVSRLPVVIWSRLYHDLEPYLTERAADGTSLLGFYHRQLREMVEWEFLDGAEQGNRHRGLAQHFGRQALWVEREDERIPNVRKVSELPYQQTNGELWGDLHKTLTDFDVLRAKCLQTGEAVSITRQQFTGVYALREDYTLALERFPDNDGWKEARGDIREWANFIRLNTPLLAQWPPALVQQAHNTSEDQRISIAAEYYHARGRTREPWFWLLNRPARSEGYLLSQRFVLDGEADIVAISADGAFIAAAIQGGTVSAWDVGNGIELIYETIDGECLAKLSFFADRFLAALTEAGRLHVYDLRGARLALGTGDAKNPVRGFATSHNSLLSAAFATGEHTVWSMLDNAQRCSFTAAKAASNMHFHSELNALICCFDSTDEDSECRIEFRSLSDGHVAVEKAFPHRWSLIDTAPTADRVFILDREAEGELCFYDLKTGSLCGVAEKKGRQPIEMTFDCKYVLTQGLKLYDASDGRLRADLTKARVTSTWGPWWLCGNGRFVIGVIYDLSHQHPDIYVFDLRKVEDAGDIPHRMLKGPPSIVDVPAWTDISTDGRWLAVARHHHIEIHDLSSDYNYRQPGHNECVTAVDILNSGRRALSGAWACNYIGGFIVWDSDTGKKWDAEGRTWVGDIATTADGAFWALGWERNKSAGIWTGTGKHIVSFDHGNEKVRQVSLNPDGRKLATYSRHEGPGQVQIWDAATGSLVARLPGYEGEDPRLEIDPNSQWLATWVPATLDFRVALFQTHEDVDAIIARAHGRIIGPPPPDESLRNRLMIWELDTGDKLADRAVASSRVNHSAFLLDGERIATCGRGEPNVRLWRLPVLAPAGDVALPSQEALYLCPHPDGSRLYAGTKESVHVIDTRNLTVVTTWPVPGRSLRVSQDGLYLFADAGDIIWMIRCESGDVLAALSSPGKTCWNIGYPNKVIVGYASGGVEIYKIANAECSTPILAVGEATI